MNRNSLIAVLIGIVLGAIVAPGASSASGSYARDATVVANSGWGNVVTSSVENAWPTLGAGVMVDADPIATPATG